jgi:hypothetical protein
MFIGHYAVGLAAKSISRKPSLGTYFAAVSFLDLLWPLLLLEGVETVSIDPGNSPFLRLAFTNYPWSHSLLMTIVWATIFSGIYYIIRRDTHGAVWLWVGVASHWILDALTHTPDLPLAPGSGILVGMGLWNSPVTTVVVEGFMFAVGIGLYLRSTKPADKTGVVSFWLLIAILIITYLASITGPPPPSVSALGWAALSGFLIVFWGYWIDRHRDPKNSLSSHKPAE